MNVVLFGATGKSGLLVTQKALEKGHHVTAYVRNPARLALQHERLTVVAGSLADQSGIDAVILGKDAVISLLGPSGMGSCDDLTAGMKLVVASMQKQGVKRLITISTGSAVDPMDSFSLSFWLAVRAIKLMQPSAYRYFVQTADLIRRSTLDWTLIRLGMLTDKESTSPLAMGYVGSPKIKLFSTSRNALADLLVAQLSDKNWLRKAPAVSNGI